MKILLIGMPGCGKTTIGKIVAKKIGLNFLDLDEVIVNENQMSINQMFADLGEKYFRNKESEALEKCLLNDNVLVSTGGGIVENSLNINKAKSMAGFVIFIDRPLNLILSDIDTTERPLLKDGAERLNKLYAKRYDLYKNSADAVVDNSQGIDAVVKSICETIVKRKLL